MLQSGHKALFLVLVGLLLWDRALGKSLVFQKVEPKAGDLPFVEFRARQPLSALETGHAFVVLGIRRDGVDYFTQSFGFTPEKNTVKSVVFAPGTIDFDLDAPYLSDTKYRAYVTEDQSRRVAFAAKRISEAGKVYAFPLQTCVSFASDLANVVHLRVGAQSPPMPRDPLLLFDPHDRSPLTPAGLVADLRSQNTPTTPLEFEIKRRAAREPELAKRFQTYQKLLREPPPRPSDNPVGRMKMEEARGTTTNTGASNSSDGWDTGLPSSSAGSKTGASGSWSNSTASGDSADDIVKLMQILQFKRPE